MDNRIQAHYIYAFDYLRDNRADLEYLLHTINTDGMLKGETNTMSRQVPSSLYEQRYGFKYKWERISIMTTYNEHRVTFEEE